MTNRMLILLMSAIGLGLAVNPATSGFSPGLFKGASWLLAGLTSRFLK